MNTQTNINYVVLPISVVATMYDSLSIEWLDDKDETHQTLLEVWKRMIKNSPDPIQALRRYASDEFWFKVEEYYKSGCSNMEWQDVAKQAISKATKRGE